ncbi:hypothetical protein Bca4012_020193 [Brassica carinata]
MVAAESYCHAQRRVLVNACKRLILRQSPTAECCLRIRRTPMWCVCSIITPQLAALVNANDVSYAVGVIRQCGRPVARGTKCGTNATFMRRTITTSYNRYTNHRITRPIH